MEKLVILSVFLFVTWEVFAYYEVPKAEFKIFYPKGFEVSIPAEENVTLFAFHGNLNKENDGVESWRWERDIVKPENGRYIFKERKTSLKLGDAISYWTSATHNEFSYNGEDELYIVTVYDAEPGNNVCRPSVTRISKDLPVACAGKILFEEDFSDTQLNTNKWTMERRFSTQPDYEFVVYLMEKQFFAYGENAFPYFLLRTDTVLQIRNSLATIRPSATAMFNSEQGNLRTELNLGPNCTGILDTDDCTRTLTSFDILPPFISAQFSTKNSFTFKYGKVEIRAKMPNAPWVFPQMFLEPVDTRYGAQNYQSGQMRIALSRSDGGNTTKELFGGVIINAEEPFRNEKMCKWAGSSINWSDDFHVFTLQWLPSKIVISVDAKVYCTIEPPEDGFSSLEVDGKSLPNKKYLELSSKMAPFDQEFYIKLGYGIGGHNDFPDDTSLWVKEKPWVNGHPKAMKMFWNKQKINLRHWLNPYADFKIDYVKVYSV